MNRTSSSGLAPPPELANAFVVRSSTAEDGEIEVRISVGSPIQAAYYGSVQVKMSLTFFPPTSANQSSRPPKSRGVVGAHRVLEMTATESTIRFSGHTLDKATKAKVTLENYYSNLIAQHIERKQR
uniref:Uncharacterized protein n=1 Tax=Timema monikensis TaxID=170555 RepID=A0A7R9DZZ7_9NEOP|nr:unnamed protein product [Timema monikensis]